MSIVSIILAIVVFSAIIIFHELGHFLLAKKNGIEVLEFSLGLGPRLLSTEKKGTRYSLKLLPFGGSCQMKGEDEDDSEEGSFNHASIGGRISVIAAGPVFNFILAFVISIIIIGVVGYDPAEVLTVEDGSPAAEAGLQKGDVITRFQGSKIDIGRDLYIDMMVSPLDGSDIKLSVKRDGETKEISYSPKTGQRYLLGFNYSQDSTAEITNLVSGGALEKAGVKSGDVITSIDGTKITNGADMQAYFAAHPLSNASVTLGYEHKGAASEVIVKPVESPYTELGFDYNLGRVKTNSLGVLKYSLIEIKYEIKTVIKSLWMLVTGKVSVNDLSGPVGVVNLIGNTYEETKSEGSTIMWMSILNMIVMLSANLGVMNLLPIPALDGGRIIFLIVEGIRGKSIDRNREAIINFVGLMLLMALIVFVTINDIRKLF